jgi:hypothetical protein
MSDGEITFTEWKTKYFKPIADFAGSKGVIDPLDFKTSWGWDGFCLDAVLATKEIDGETATDGDCLSYLVTLTAHWEEGLEYLA